jgi:hypothetical protein
MSIGKNDVEAISNAAWLLWVAVEGFVGIGNYSKFVNFFRIEDRVIIAIKHKRLWAKVIKREFPRER